MFLRKFTKAINPYLNSVQQRASGDICSEQDFSRLLELERARADRSNQKVSLVVFNISTTTLKNENYINLIATIRGRIRCIDEAGWYDNQRIGMILPFTSNEGAIKLAENICNSLDESIPKPVCAVYTYPIDKIVTK